MARFGASLSFFCPFFLLGFLGFLGTGFSGFLAFFAAGFFFAGVFFAAFLGVAFLATFFATFFTGDFFCLCRWFLGSTFLCYLLRRGFGNLLGGGLRHFCVLYLALS